MANLGETGELLEPGHAPYREDVDPILEAARAALPPLEGEVRVPGLQGTVQVLRDPWGVPHLRAGSLHDAWLAQGYLLASERLFQIEMSARFSTGRLSEVFGELTLPLDRFVRTLGWHRVARRHLESWDEASWEMARAFTAGVRAWIETMPAPPLEHRILGLEPWYPSEPEEGAHVAAAGAVFMAWTLSRGWDNDLLRAEVSERIGTAGMRALFPDLEADADVVRAGKDGGDARMALLEQALLPPSGIGSNNWVVAGSRSVTGGPLLANDPHLAVQWPSAWYEIHLEAPGLNVAGVCLPFSPGVVIGHNERIAWGFTNVEGDVQDLYLERLSSDGTAAERNGAWEPLTVHREEILVRGRTEPEILEVRETRHGPLLDSYTIGIGNPEVVEGGIRKTYSLRWTGFEHMVRPSTVHAVDTAHDWASFREALRGWGCPGQNAVYADVDGNIGYQCTGVHPIRRAGDGTLPVIGWTDDYEWIGEVPFDELPRAYNPPEGFLLTANARPYGEDYPHHLGSDFLPPFRARRIAELLTATPLHSRETFAHIQTDTVSLSARRVLPLLLRLEPEGARQKEALALLAEWDGDLAADSAAAAVYHAWTVEVARGVLLPLLGEELFRHVYARRQWSNGFLHTVLPSLLAYPAPPLLDGPPERDALLREALDAGLDHLTERLGEEMAAWRWGAVHRARFAGPLARIPDLADVFTAGEAELGGDDQTVLQALYEPGVPFDVQVTASWRQILDPSDWDASVGTHTVGQSGNPASPHHRDLLPLWAAGDHHPMPFTLAAVDAAAINHLTLLP